ARQKALARAAPGTGDRAAPGRARPRLRSHTLRSGPAGGRPGRRSLRTRCEVLHGRLPPRLPEPSAWPVYSAADWIWGAVSVAGAVLLALALLHRRRLPAACRSVTFRMLRPPVAFLHRVHTGVVGDYAAWLAAGAALCAVVWGATLR